MPRWNQCPSQELSDKFSCAAFRSAVRFPKLGEIEKK